MSQDSIYRLLEDGKVKTSKQMQEVLELSNSSINTALRKLVKQGTIFRIQRRSETTRIVEYIYWRENEHTKTRP